MPYITTYTICGITHEWTTDNPIDGVDANNVLYMTTNENQIYKILLEMLEWFQGVAIANDIKWFAMSGTLLGAVRNKGIIPHDNDIDLGVPISEYWKLKQLCGQNKSGLYDVQLTESCGFRIFQTNGTKFPFTDIFVMAEENGVMKYAAPFYKDKPCFYTSRMFEKEWIDICDLDNLKTATFEYLTIPIPDNADKWLKRAYGDDCYTRYVPDTRLPILHEIVEQLPLYEMEQTLGFILRDVLQLDKSDNPDAHIACLIQQLVFAGPMQLSQNPKHLLDKINRNILTFIHANLEAGGLPSPLRPPCSNTK